MKVLNFGSLNIDNVYRVEHFVRKGETLSSEGMAVYGGGKGLNQSIALSKAGANVYHAGLIGTDGAFLLELLNTAGVNISLIECARDIHTGNAIIQIDRQGDNCILLYGGANKIITSDMIDRVFSFFEKGDLLVLQNEVNMLPYMIEAARKKGMLVALNPSPIDEAIHKIDFGQIDYLFLNESEAQTIAGEQLGETMLLDKICSRFPNINIILTLGEKGAMFAGGGTRSRQRSCSVPVVDTTAAGDTFTGYFLAVILEGGTVECALALAAKAAAIAVTRKGAAVSIPERSEVEQYEM